MGNLSTPKSVQKLQKALHAKAKAEAGYRFYALYDKISREDILAHAYAQCRSNKGAPGVDGQDFADIEAYGVQRWLGELALALRQETYRPDPIRRVFIPKANGKLRPLGISTLRDRVCMTAAMLVLEPIFEADLPPEQYAYRPGRNAQQAVVEVEGLLFRGHPEVVEGWPVTGVAAAARGQARCPAAAPPPRPAGPRPRARWPLLSTPNRSTAKPWPWAVVDYIGEAGPPLSRDCSMPRSFLRCW